MTVCCGFKTLSQFTQFLNDLLLSCLRFGTLKTCAKIFNQLLEFSYDLTRSAWILLTSLVRAVLYSGDTFVVLIYLSLLVDMNSSCGDRSVAGEELRLLQESRTLNIFPLFGDHSNLVVSLKSFSEYLYRPQ